MPNGLAPHRKALTAGSDDHGHQRAATIYTEVDGADLDPAAFLHACVTGRARTVDNVEKPAHLGAATGVMGGVVNRLMGALGGRRPASDDDVRVVEGLATAARTFNIRGVMGGVRKLFGGLRTAIPVLAAAHRFGKQASQVRKLREQWNAYPLPAPERRLALFSDSLEQVDGVSTWCKRFVARARAAGHTVLLPQCCPEAGDDQVPGLTSFAVPLYPACGSTCRR